MAKKNGNNVHEADASGEDFDLKELFGDNLKLADERAWYTSEVDAPVIGIAYLLEHTTVGTGADQRVVPAVVVRCLAPTVGMRNDKMVDVRAGEDIQMIASYAVNKRVLGPLASGPVVCRIKRGESRAHPSKKGQQLRDYDIQAWPMELTPDSKYLTAQVRSDVKKAYALMSEGRRDTARALAQATETETAAAPF